MTTFFYLKTFFDLNYFEHFEINLKKLMNILGFCAIFEDFHEPPRFWGNLHIKNQRKYNEGSIFLAPNQEI